ncbi:hypothetical protein [Mycobacteroides abscessus]|uniref:hypothetical protein n=1 Tax=Mycobacteroides abscessus TaxID=36809 RepID=UPI0012FFFE5A|nr:hypothetical protein [Mycobacteroides abscessus]
MTLPRLDIRQHSPQPGGLTVPPVESQHRLDDVRRIPKRGVAAAGRRLVANTKYLYDPLPKLVRGADGTA